MTKRRRSFLDREKHCNQSIKNMINHEYITADNDQCLTLTHYKCTNARQVEVLVSNTGKLPNYPQQMIHSTQWLWCDTISFNAIAGGGRDIVQGHHLDCIIILYPSVTTLDTSCLTFWTLLSITDDGMLFKLSHIDQLSISFLHKTPGLNFHPTYIHTQISGHLSKDTITVHLSKVPHWLFLLPRFKEIHFLSSDSAPCICVN